MSQAMVDTQMQQRLARLDELKGEDTYQGMSDRIRLRTGFNVSAQAIHKWFNGGNLTRATSEALHKAYDKPLSWLEFGDQAVESNVVKKQITGRLVEVPISATGGGMSRTGKAVAEYDMLAGSLPLDQNWIRHELPELSNPNNLAIMPGYGDSMLGTYNDGDLLFVDRGVLEVKLDAVYAFRNDGDMYIKRIQRLPTGTLKIISDNRKYESYEISKKQWKDFTMVGRVLGALNWHRM